MWGQYPDIWAGGNCRVNVRTEDWFMRAKEKMPMRKAGPVYEHVRQSHQMTGCED
jgi:hypothetical protein